MRKSFLTLAIVAILMTMITTLRSDNDTYNEDRSRKTYYYWNNKVWKVKQTCTDSEDNLYTYAYAAAMQYPEGHNLYASVSFTSGYTDPKIKGTWYLRAELHHPWATDEEPFEDNGEIKGKQDGMYKHGKQADKDWFDE